MENKVEKKVSIIKCPNCKKEKEVLYRGKKIYWNLCAECFNNQYGEYKKDN
jgi:cytochrome c1